MPLRPPNTARGFEPDGGIAGYIRKLRLNQAFQEITAAEFANQSIGHIAYRRNLSSETKNFTVAPKKPETTLNSRKQRPD
jgi:hypothetical protein